MLFSFFACCTGIWTQSLMLARLACATTPSHWLRWGLKNILPWLASYHNPPHLHFPSSFAYRIEPPCLALGCFFSVYFALFYTSFLWMGTTIIGLFSLFWAVLEFEFRALHLLGRHSITLSPALFSFSYFSDRVLHSCPGWPWTQIPPPRPPI
jgi:hypothetical protein